MTAGSGPSSLGCFAIYDPASRSWRTPQVSFLLAPTDGGARSERFSETWPRSGTVRGGRAFELPTWALPICASGGSVSLHWATPTASHLTGSNRSASANAVVRPNLGAAVRNWPTPRATESELSTYASCPSHGTSHGEHLQAVVIAQDGDPTTPAQGEKRAEIGALNPAWEEILMGFPEGWTDVGRSLPKAPKSSRASKATAGPRAAAKRSTRTNRHASFAPVGDVSTV